MEYSKKEIWCATSRVKFMPIQLRKKARLSQYVLEKE
jgi:hypothetical protein